MAKNKICGTCKIEKPLSEFYPYKDKHQYSCKKCSDKQNRQYKIKRAYGLSLEEWENKFNSQKGCCAICGINQSELKDKLSTDHNHVTGKIRDLLCHRCNSLVGQVEVNPKLLDSITSYIERHNV